MKDASTTRPSMQARANGAPRSTVDATVDGTSRSAVEAPPHLQPARERDTSTRAFSGKGGRRAWPRWGGSALNLTPLCPPAGAALRRCIRGVCDWLVGQTRETRHQSR